MEFALTRNSDCPGSSWPSSRPMPADLQASKHCLPYSSLETIQEASSSPSLLSDPGGISRKHSSSSLPAGPCSPGSIRASFSEPFFPYVLDEDDRGPGAPAAVEVSRRLSYGSVISAAADTPTTRKNSLRLYRQNSTLSSSSSIRRHSLRSSRDVKLQSPGVSRSFASPAARKKARSSGQRFRSFRSNQPATPSRFGHSYKSSQDSAVESFFYPFKYDLDDYSGPRESVTHCLDVAETSRPSLEHDKKHHLSLSSEASLTSCHNSSNMTSPEIFTPSSGTRSSGNSAGSIQFSPHHLYGKHRHSEQNDLANSFSQNARVVGSTQDCRSKGTSECSFDASESTVTGPPATESPTRIAYSDGDGSTQESSGPLTPTKLESNEHNAFEESAKVEETSMFPWSHMLSPHPKKNTSTEALPYKSLSNNEHHMSSHSSNKSRLEVDTDDALDIPTDDSLYIFPLPPVKSPDTFDGKLGSKTSLKNQDFLVKPPPGVQKKDSQRRSISSDNGSDDEDGIEPLTEEERKLLFSPDSESEDDEDKDGNRSATESSLVKATDKTETTAQKTVQLRQLTLSKRSSASQGTKAYDRRHSTCLAPNNITEPQSSLRTWSPTFVRSRSEDRLDVLKTGVGAGAGPEGPAHSLSTRTSARLNGKGLHLELPERSDLSESRRSTSANSIMSAPLESGPESKWPGNHGMSRRMSQSQSSRKAGPLGPVVSGSHSIFYSERSVSLSPSISRRGSYGGRPEAPAALSPQASLSQSTPLSQSFMNPMPSPSSYCVKSPTQHRFRRSHDISPTPIKTDEKPMLSPTTTARTSVSSTSYIATRRNLDEVVSEGEECVEYGYAL